MNKQYDILLTGYNGPVTTIEKKTLSVPITDLTAIDLLDQLYKQGYLEHEDENRYLAAIVARYEIKKEKE